MVIVIQYDILVLLLHRIVASVAACLLDCNRIWFHFVSFHIVFIFSLSLSASLSIFLFLAASVREPCASDDVCFPFLMSFVFIASFSISFAQVLALKNHYLFLYHLFCHIIIFLFDCIFMACARARFFPLCVHAYVRVHSTMYNNTF